MREFIAVIVSFLTIPFLNKKNVPIGIAICICAVMMALIGGLDFADMGAVLAGTFLNIRKVQQYIIILEVGILGVLLKQYGIIDHVINYLISVVRSKRFTLMFIPALVGLLSVPGGAIMSAPFINGLGEDSNIPHTKRAIINLVYRHIAMNIMPYSSGFLLIASIAPEIPIYSLIGLNIIFVILYCLLGYYLYIRQVKEDAIPSGKPILPNLIKLLKYTSPVYTAVLLNLFFKVPFYFGMLINLCILYMLHPTKTFLKDAAKAFSIKILIAIIGVYLIQGVMGQMGSLLGFLTNIFSNESTIMLGIIITAFFFGITTGFQPTALGVVIPILLMLPISSRQLLLYTHFTYIWSFIGYFFSPLHLCQLFTCEYMQVSTADLYKDYWKFFLSLLIVIIANYFVMSILFI